MVISFVVAWMILTFLMALLICQPINMNWDPSITNGHCGDKTAAFASIGVFNLILDLVIFVLPLPMVLQLQVATVHKIALGLIFGVGVL